MQQQEVVLGQLRQPKMKCLVTSHRVFARLRDLRHSAIPTKVKERNCHNQQPSLFKLVSFRSGYVLDFNFMQTVQNLVLPCSDRYHLYLVAAAAPIVFVRTLRTFSDFQSAFARM
jgi:hypothetical protein